MHLGFDLFPLPVFAHISGINFTVEVADVAHHRASFHGAQHRCVTDVDVTGGGHDKVGVTQQVDVNVRVFSGVDAVFVGRYHFKAIHTGLHGAAGVIGRAADRER